MPDIFDRIKLDIFDQIDLPVEDKVIFSDEMRTLLRDEITKRIAELPIGKLIAQVIEKQITRQLKDQNPAEMVAKSVGSSESKLDKKIADTRAALQKELDELKKLMREKYDDLKTELRQPLYTFGGFSPQTNDLNIGDPAIEGAWRIVKSGSNLSMQRFESGIWTEKGSFTP